MEKVEHRNTGGWESEASALDSVSAPVAAVAGVAAAVVLALVGAVVGAGPFPPVPVMPATGGALVFVLLGSGGVGAAVAVPGLAGGPRAAAGLLPLVGVAALQLELVRPVLGLQVRQQRRRPVVLVSPRRRAAAVGSTAGARTVGSRAAPPVVVMSARGAGP